MVVPRALYLQLNRTPHHDLQSFHTFLNEVKARTL